MKKNKNVLKAAVLLIAVMMLSSLAGCKHDKAITLQEIGSDPEEIADEVPESAEQPPSYAPAESPDEPETLCVYVCGKVVSPGVYELPNGSRVCDALEAAGGFTEGADESRINLARTVFDGEMIYFPAPGEEIPAGQLNPVSRQSPANQDAPSSGNAPGSALVNINTATKDRLTSLPGIGESKASAIIKYRDDNGFFKDIKDIKNVPGIGDALYSGIEDLICI